MSTGSAAAAPRTRQGTLPRTLSVIERDENKAPRPALGLSLLHERA